MASVYEVLTCCCGIFEFWSKLAFTFYQQVKKIGPRMPLGRLNSVQGVPHRASEKQVAKKTRRNWNVSISWLQNGSHNLKVACFLLIFGDVFPHRFWDWSLIDFGMLFGYGFVYLSCSFGISLVNFLKPADVAKICRAHMGAWLLRFGTSFSYSTFMSFLLFSMICFV